MQPSHNDSVQESLNRYIDGDLSGEEAMRLAATLSTDRALREDERTLRAVRSAVRSAAARMATGDSETARLRAMARLRATVESEQWQQSRAPSRPSFRFDLGWRPTLATFGVAAAVVGSYLLIPQTIETVPATPATTEVSVAPLPTEDEMSLLYDLHDVHYGVYSGEEAVFHRSHLAEAQAALLERADRTVGRSL